MELLNRLGDEVMQVAPGGHVALFEHDGVAFCIGYVLLCFVRELEVAYDDTGAFFVAGFCEGESDA